MLDWELPLVTGAPLVGVWLLLSVAQGQRAAGRAVSLFALDTYLIGVALVTWLPIILDSEARFGRPPASSVSWVPFATVANYLDLVGETALRQVGGNLLLLVPLGIAIRLLWPVLSVRRVLVILLATAGVIEAVQYVELATGIAPGRAVDVDDVILNVTGALGAWAVTRAVDRAIVDGRPARVRDWLRGRSPAADAGT